MKTYYHKDNRLNVESEKYLGSGSQWDVYKINLVNEKLIENTIVNTMIYKKNRNNDEYFQKKNLEIFIDVKNAGLQTLKYYDPGKIDFDDIIIAEDLNQNKRIYVSPNSARRKNNISEMITAALNNKTISDGLEDVPETEKLLMNNKINEITNFNDLFVTIQNEMEIATSKNLCMCADAFFFGLIPEVKTSIDIKIADFDNISKYKISKKNKYGNENEMLSAYWEFVDNFVCGTNEKEYKSIIEERKRLLMSK